MDDYKPNSYRYKEEQKEKQREKERVQKVVKGKVITKKPSKVRQIADEFISEDAKNVKSYVFGEVLIPAIKKAISDIVTDGIDIILYGEARGGRKRSTAEKVSYTTYWDRDRGTSNRQSQIGSGYSPYDITLDHRAEAEEVLERMNEISETYGMVSVADFYDLVGVTGNYTDNKYGWMNVRSAEVVRVKDGYKIKLPRAVPLD